MPINQFHSINLAKLLGVASILILVLIILATALFQSEAPKIKPAIVRIKLTEGHTNNQIQKFQPLDAKILNKRDKIEAVVLPPDKF